MSREGKYFLKEIDNCINKIEKNKKNMKSKKEKEMELS